MRKESKQEPILPDALYPLAVAQQVMGFGPISMRNARKSGLRAKYVNGRCYIAGAELIRYVMEKGKDAKNAPAND